MISATPKLKMLAEEVRAAEIRLFEAIKVELPIGCLIEYEYGAIRRQARVVEHEWSSVMPQIKASNEHRSFWLDADRITARIE